jgi:hypothetical protein
MATLRVQASDGKTLKVQVPEGTDPSQYGSFADDALAHYNSTAGKGARALQKGSNLAGASGIQEAKELYNDPNKSKGRKAWDALTIPAKMSERGLQGIANLVPEGKVTGNMATDVARGSLKILANTMAQVPPGFISRASMLGGLGSKAIGAAKPLIKAIGGGVGGQLESLSGARPGSLSAAYNDPSIMFSRVTPEAKGAYEAENLGLKASKLVQENPNPLKLAQKARKLAQQGTLTEGEALEGRKAVDQLWKSRQITEGWKNSTRELLDNVVKSKSELAEADKTFRRAKIAESLRKVMPQNKYGGTSAFKTGIMTALHGMPGGNFAGALMSPAASGSSATVLGALNKAGLGQLVSNPSQAVKLLQAIRLRQQQQQAQ